MLTPAPATDNNADTRKVRRRLLYNKTDQKNFEGRVPQIPSRCHRQRQWDRPVLSRMGADSVHCNVIKFSDATKSFHCNVITFSDDTKTLAHGRHVIPMFIV